MNSAVPYPIGHSGGQCDNTRGIYIREPFEPSCKVNEQSVFQRADGDRQLGPKIAYFENHRDVQFTGRIGTWNGYGQGRARRQDYVSTDVSRLERGACREHYESHNPAPESHSVGVSNVKLMHSDAVDDIAVPASAACGIVTARGNDVNLVTGGNEASCHLVRARASHHIGPRKVLMYIHYSQRAHRSLLTPVAAAVRR